MYSESEISLMRKQRSREIRSCRLFLFLQYSAYSGSSHLFLLKQQKMDPKLRR